MRALGYRDVGRIAEGWQADFSLVRTDTLCTVNRRRILTNLLYDCFEFIIAFSGRVIQTPILIKRSANKRAADIAAHGNSDIRLWNCRNQLGILCLFHVDAI